MLPPPYRKIIHLADKYAFGREHSCLVPRCNRRAIRCHAIPLASMKEALAVKGFVYTQRYSFGSMMRMKTAAEPVEVIEVGVKKAGVFKGFCSKHDARLFASLERTDPDKKKELAQALHLRALSFEFCRKQLAIDFTVRINELAKANALLLPPNDLVEHYPEARDSVKREIYGLLFRKNLKRQENLSYVCFLLCRNILLSCCGIFTQAAGHEVARVGYNIISYKDMSIVMLTTFQTTEKYLDALLSEYGAPGNLNLEQLVNDVAFYKGEEPLISPLLWRSLDEEQQLRVREALRHPSLRTGSASPRIVRLNRDDYVSKPTPAMWARFLEPLSPP